VGKCCISVCVREREREGQMADEVGERCTAHAGRCGGSGSWLVGCGAPGVFCSQHAHAWASGAAGGNAYGCVECEGSSLSNSPGCDVEAGKEGSKRARRSSDLPTALFGCPCSFSPPPSFLPSLPLSLSLSALARLTGASAPAPAPDELWPHLCSGQATGGEMGDGLFRTTRTL